MPFLVLVGASLIMRWLNFIGLVVMMVGGFTLEASSC